MVSTSSASRSDIKSARLHLDVRTAERHANDLQWLYRMQMKLEITLISIGFACLRGRGIPLILLYGTNKAMYCRSVTMLWFSEKIVHDRIQSFTSSVHNTTQHFPFSSYIGSTTYCVSLCTLSKNRFVRLRLNRLLKCESTCMSFPFTIDTSSSIS